ncbi:hypothetical protein XELAEV_18022098mg [Xenopus laevis]|uniref:Uncharacterized protein n=1 Tax=Xenopus laevis TaxID=8355 RepID=A0A974HN45_XENLA|nr:hypothetical protein XELAEV_18022098mg [Xenopus laevis]
MSGVVPVMYLTLNLPFFITHRDKARNLLLFKAQICLKSTLNNITMYLRDLLFSHIPEPSGHVGELSN